MELEDINDLDDIDVRQVLVDYGEEIACKEWDSGIMAGVVSVYRLGKSFYSVYDEGIDIYDSASKALERSGVTWNNEATRSIWIHPAYQNE